MYEVIHKDCLLMTTSNRKDAVSFIIQLTDESNLSFWQETSHPYRTDYIFTRSNDENKIEVYTIIKEI